MNLQALFARRQPFVSILLLCWAQITTAVMEHLALTPPNKRLWTGAVQRATAPTVEPKPRSEHRRATIAHAHEDGVSDEQEGASQEHPPLSPLADPADRPYPIGPIVFPLLTDHSRLGNPTTSSASSHSSASTATSSGTFYYGSDADQIHGPTLSASAAIVLGVGSALFVFLTMLFCLRRWILLDPMLTTGSRSRRIVRSQSEKPRDIESSLPPPTFVPSLTGYPLNGDSRALAYLKSIHARHLDGLKSLPVLPVKWFSKSRLSSVPEIWVTPPQEEHIQSVLPPSQAQQARLGSLNMTQYLHPSSAYFFIYNPPLQPTPETAG